MIDFTDGVGTKDFVEWCANENVMYLNTGETDWDDNWYNIFEEDIPSPNLKIRKMTSRWGVCNIKNKNFCNGKKSVYKKQILATKCLPILKFSPEEQQKLLSLL